jgi:ATP-dependent DNA helicase RecG
LTDDSTRKAWCWFDLARTLAWLRVPNSEVDDAYMQAIALKPDENRFRDTYREWQSR